MLTLRQGIRSAVKALPGVRRLVADRNRWRQTAADLEMQVAQLVAERADLRESLADARLSLDDWQPPYIQNKPLEKSHQNWDEFYAICRDLGAVRPNSAVLDIGCGVGGLATRFAGFLDDDGQYHGLDVDARAIAVCKGLVQSTNVQFGLLDVRNDQYNPNGEIAATDVVLPVPDAAFDVAIARSLFTHMFPDGVMRYVAEIARTLRVGGRALVTAFLFNDAIFSRLRATGPQSIWSFSHDRGTYRLEDPDRPLTAVALQESYVRKCFSAAHLDIVEPIRYGSWSGTADSLAYQDMVVAERR